MNSKKLGELLLKGWRMLDETCPETGEVPLTRGEALGYAEEVRAKLWAEHMWAFLATIYLFLPACSQAQFEALDCKTL